MPLKINEDGTLPMWIDPATGRRYLESAVEEAVVGGGGGGGPHTHPETDVTNLTADLAAKAASGHNHDAAYVHAHPYAATSHSHLDADIPAGIARDAEVTAAIATHAATPHGGEGGGFQFPIGALYLSVTATNPAIVFGYGTWAQRAQGLFLVGQTGGQQGGDQIGSATHSHGFTQPDAHAALSHSGATVADHADVLNHTHAVSINDPGHFHDEYRNSATTGGLDGWAAGDTSTNTPLLTGYDTGSKVTGITATSANPAGGVAAVAHTVGQAAQHAAQSHTGGAVADGTVTPPGFVAYIWERTA